MHDPMPTVSRNIGFIRREMNAGTAPDDPRTYRLKLPGASTCATDRILSILDGGGVTRRLCDGLNRGRRSGTPSLYGPVEGAKSV